MAIEFTEGRVVPIRVADEMRRSYIDYAMSVIVDRALPDVRDGLKPVQRRILYAHERAGHPPGPAATASRRVSSATSWASTIPTATRPFTTPWCAWRRTFRIRYPLVDGHGNFGSVDGDPPAAMRYTEARLSRDRHGDAARHRQRDRRFRAQLRRIAASSRSCLPSRIPNLLVNGAAGIAVGMATNIPPHNLTEVIDGLIDAHRQSRGHDRGADEHHPGPGFPHRRARSWAGTASRRRTRTGRGRVRVRGQGADRADGQRAPAHHRHRDCPTRSTRPT